MRAFVRFREVDTPGDKPGSSRGLSRQHHIVERNAPFFADRFASMRWSILTPDRCAHWDGQAAHLHRRRAACAKRPTRTQMEDLWRTYYANIFNPARVKVHAMQAEMPKKYWKNLPEADAYPLAPARGAARVETMMKKSAAKIAQTDGERMAPAPAPETRA